MIAKLLASTFGLKGMLIAAAVTTGIGFAGGVWVRDAFCDAAAAKVELEIERAKSALLQKQLAIQNEIASFAVSTHERLMQDSIDLNRKVADYETELARKPVAQCRIDDTDLRFRDGLRKRPAKR